MDTLRPTSSVFAEIESGREYRGILQHVQHERGDGVKSVLDQSLAFYLMLLGLGESAPTEDATHGPTQRYNVDVGGNGEIRFNGRLIDPVEFGRRMRMLQIRAARPGPR